jgi:hypothetical protein
MIIGGILVILLNLIFLIISLVLGVFNLGVGVNVENTIRTFVFLNLKNKRYLLNFANEQYFLCNVLNYFEKNIIIK